MPRWESNPNRGVMSSLLDLLATGQ
ncbi:hypothetical protein PI27_gp030 [Listeria phage WIL-1]|nr:hypothetical protein PI27_gp030 [Listeria phage WIL-1]